MRRISATVGPGCRVKVPSAPGMDRAEQDCWGGGEVIPPIVLFYPARTHASRHTEPRLRAPECGLPLYFPLMMTRSPTGRLIPIPNLTMSQYCSRAIQSAHGTLKPGSQLTDKIRSGNLSQINIMGLVIVMPKPFRRKLTV